jgi:hypothetical protein
MKDSGTQSKSGHGKDKNNKAEDKGYKRILKDDALQQS